MQKDSIIFMLKSHGVNEEDLAAFSLKLRDKSFTVDDCDKLLVKLGYEKLFTIEDEISKKGSDIEDDDLYAAELGDFDDDGYSDYESFHKKSTFDD
ncbi:MAG: hypothetical protein WBG69_06825 [Arcobacteraceae bacterium]